MSRRFVASDSVLADLVIAGAVKCVVVFYNVFFNRHCRNKGFERRTGFVGVANRFVTPHFVARLVEKLGFFFARKRIHSVDIRLIVKRER